MKSAYELAMERLRASDPDAGAPLTAEQKARLADIERVYRGKTAEREIFLQKQLNDLLAAGNEEEAEKVRKQLVSERVRLAEEMEAEKDKVRREKAPPSA
jgi:Spy/CpxP family protein refolding chaperone